VRPSVGLASAAMINMGILTAVAIDGPAGAGKSTVARGVAENLGFLYIDTGAMYRAVTLQAKQTGIDLNDSEKLEAVANQCKIQFTDNGTRILVNGKDVTTSIRTQEITRDIKYAAHSPSVRNHLVEQQQDLAKEGPVVMEGRDITTVVLPQAKWKFFLSASDEVKAKRRMKDFQITGNDQDYATVLREIQKRDSSDLQVGPLKDAYEIAKQANNEITLIDTTTMSLDEVITQIVKQVKQTI